MDLETLFVLLPTQSPTDIRSWLNDYSIMHPDAEIEEFLTHLRDTETISDLEFLEAINGQRLHLENETLPGWVEKEEITAVSQSWVNGFDILDVLGEGAMGMVHAARDVSLGRRVALKSIHASTNDKSGEERFRREIKITAQLEHPNIMQIYSMENTSDGRLAYTMKWIKGRVLTDFIQDCQNSYTEGTEAGLSLEDRLDVFLKLCDAMHYAHKKRVIHRDLKPDNIMIGAFGEVIVMDWGIARIIGAQRDENDGNPEEEVELVGDAQTTQDGAIVGSVGYMSPEQARGDIEELDDKSDQYALGLILFELVTLRRGIPDGRLMDMLRRARRGQIAPIVHLSAKRSIRKELIAIIEKATENDQRNRYANVDELGDDIRRFLREDPVLARPDPPVTKVTRWISKNRMKSLLTILCIGVFGLVSNVYNLHTQQQERQEHHYRQKELRDQAELRAKKMGEIITSVSSQGNKVDERLLFYLGSLRELGATAQTRLQLRPDLTVPPKMFRSADYATAQTAPPDWKNSPRYKREISIDHPVVKIAPNVEMTGEVELEAQHLALLQPTFLDVFIDSSEASGTLTYEEKRKLIAVDGTPIVWAFVGTEKGIHAAFPGKGPYDITYDPRERPWYKNSVERPEPHCQKPYQDVMGQGLILPCTMLIQSETKDVLGVAGVEFTLDFIVETLLELPGYTDFTKSYLVDGDGNILISSENAEADNKQFPEERIVNEIQRKNSGYLVRKTDDQSELIFYSYLETSGWYYIVSGLEENLLPAE